MQIDHGSNRKCAPLLTSEARAFYTSRFITNRWDDLIMMRDMRMREAVDVVVAAIGEIDRDIRHR